MTEIASITEIAKSVGIEFDVLDVTANREEAFISKQQLLAFSQAILEASKEKI